MTFISVCLPFSYSLSSFRMLNVGLPVGAVKNALQRDGQDPSVMDLDQNRYVTLSTFICKEVLMYYRSFSPTATTPILFLTFTLSYFDCAIAGPSKFSSMKGISTETSRCRNGCKVRFLRFLQYDVHVLYVRFADKVNDGEINFSLIVAHPVLLMRKFRRESKFSPTNS